MLMGIAADDITGSNDIGIMFAKAGLRTHVYSYAGPGDLERHRGLWPEPDICILDTNSRLDPADVAYRKVHAASLELREAGYRQFFKKTCSAFRGNVGAEFDAMLDALGLDFAVVVVGFPKNGRTTIDGIHYIHGQRLEDSAFRNDPIHPMRQSNLVDILQAQTRRRVGLVTHAVLAQGAAALRRHLDGLRGQYEYVILDVPDQAGLRTIAAAIHDLPVLCGSSALGEELPPVWGCEAAPPEALGLPRLPGVGVPCVAGSLTPETAAQVEHLRAQGVPVITLDTAALPDPATRQAEAERVLAALVDAMQSGRDVVVHSANDPEAVAATRAAGAARGMPPTTVARLVSDALASVTAAALEATGQNRLVVAGGETSNAVCARLGVTGLRIWQEIQPGLPSCVTLTDPARLLVLKSGSFGSPDFLALALEHVKSQ